MNHIVITCPLTKFEGGLNLLHEVDDDTVTWLESTATAAIRTAQHYFLLHLNSAIFLCRKFAAF